MPQNNFFAPSHTATKEQSLPTTMDVHNFLMKASPKYASEYYMSEKDAMIQEEMRLKKQAKTDPLASFVQSAEDSKLPIDNLIGGVTKFMTGSNVPEAIIGTSLGLGAIRALGVGANATRGMFWNAGMAGSDAMRLVRNVETVAEEVSDDPINLFRGIKNDFKMGDDLPGDFEPISFKNVLKDVKEGARRTRDYKLDPIGGVPEDFSGSPSLNSSDEGFDAFEEYLNENRKPEMNLYQYEGTPKNHFSLEAFIPIMRDKSPLERGKILAQYKENLFKELDDLQAPYVVHNDNSMSANSYPLSLKMLNEYIQKKGYKTDQTKIVFSPNNGYVMNNMGLRAENEGMQIANKYLNTLKRVSDVRGVGNELTEPAPYSFLRLYGLTGLGLGMNQFNER